MQNFEGDNAVIDLRSEEDAEFRIDKVDEGSSSMTADEMASRSPETLKIKFSKFVSLVSNHDFDEVLEKHGNEDIIITTSLLTDLANIPQEKAERRMPGIFVLGILLGVILTWIFIKT